jgi:hypothetical protein
MAVLLQYAFANANPSTTAAGLTGSAYTNGSLFYFAKDAVDPTWEHGPAASTNIAQAVTNNSYCYFTATPDGGKKLDLASLTFICGKGGASVRGYGIRSSVDAYGSDLQTADVTAVWSSYDSISLDLSGASFQGLTSAITFRLYFYSPDTGSHLWTDNLTLNGTVGDAAPAGFTGLTVTKLLNG